MVGGLAKSDSMHADLCQTTKHMKAADLQPERPISKLEGIEHACSRTGLD